MIEWVEVHEGLYREYLQMRRWGVTPSDHVMEDERIAREKDYRGLGRLSHLVPKWAPDQETLARLLAETAVLSHRRDFVDADVVRKTHELYQLVDGKPAHRELRDGLRSHVESLPDPDEAIAERNNRIVFAVWMALEADVNATSKPGACSMVADALKKTGLADIGSDSVATIWRDRSAAKDKRGRGPYRRQW
ncbi:hypothetical protein [Algiphilus sp.]|uniref:hypothetical protein n=1 Tax=Algiphilus sp. TaxID=1872431 RepID=UPI0032EF5BC3